MVASMNEGEHAAVKAANVCTDALETRVVLNHTLSKPGKTNGTALSDLPIFFGASAPGTAVLRLRHECTKAAGMGYKCVAGGSMSVILRAHEDVEPRQFRQFTDTVRRA